MMRFLSFFALASAPVPIIKNQQHRRTFQFVPYGSSAPVTSDTSTPTISCDGRVPGSTLELTHWTDNITPEELYADTSTEIALKFAQQIMDSDGKYNNVNFDDATILNNHYDTDGVLSVWSCLNPQDALDRSDVLVAGAEAGDFGEWSSDLGVKLDCALCDIEAGCDSEQEAYEVALDMLPDLLSDLESNAGKKYKHLWQYGWNDAVSGWTDIVEKRIRIEAAGAGSIAMVTEDPSTTPLSPYALHRSLKEAGLAGDQRNAVDRVLHARSDGEGRYQYRYNKPGYGWVSRLASRKPVMSVNSEALIEALNSSEGCEGSWTDGEGLTGICQTKRSVKVCPLDLLKKLRSLDGK